MLMAILSSFPFFAGDTTTAFLEEHPSLLSGSLLPEGQNPPPALVVAAAFHCLDTLDAAEHWITDMFSGNLAVDPVPPRFRNVSGTPGFLGLQYGSGETSRRVWVLYESARHNRWRIWLNPGDEPFSAERESIGEVRVTRPAADEDSLPGQYLLVEIDGLVSRVETDADDAGVRVAGVDGRFQFRPMSVGERSDAGSGDQGPVSPLPGTVAAIEVEPGQQVAEGEPLVVLEAMKMEHRITADTEGVIDQVLVTPGQSVEAHQVLVTFAAGGEDD